MKNCKNCGTQLSDSAKFCPECGTKQEEKKKFCSECGIQLQPSSKFCPECGTPADSGKVANKNNSNTIAPSPQKNQKKLTGFEEIKEKGGIIVYDPESYPSIVDKILTEIFTDYKKQIQSVGGILQEALKIFKSEDTEWEKFGEPAKNVARYGYPEDDYDEGIYYHIHDKETLILKGEGNTFRILSEEDQKKADNFWILNADIRKLQGKIKNLIVFGDDTGIRARLFKDFEKLEVVHFYGYVTSVRREAFWNCPIKYLGLSEDIDAIVEDSFMGAKFKYLIFPVFTSLDEFEFQDHCFVDCKELKYVLISEYLYDYMDEDLEDCFQGCDKLNTQNVWSIDEDLKIEHLSEGPEDDLENILENTTAIMEKNNNMEERKKIAKEGWEKSIELARKTSTAAIPLHKMDDGYMPKDDIKSEASFFLFSDGEGEWHAMYDKEWDEVEEFIENHPEFVDIYYSDSSFVELLIWNDDFVENYSQCEWDGCGIEYGVMEYINQETNPDYLGPAVPISLIYNGEEIREAYPGTQDVDDWLDEQNGEEDEDWDENDEDFEED